MDVVVLKRELFGCAGCRAPSSLWSARGRGQLLRQPGVAPNPVLMDLYSQKEFSSQKRLTRSTKRTIPTIGVEEAAGVKSGCVLVVAASKCFDRQMEFAKSLDDCLSDRPID